MERKILKVVISDIALKSLEQIYEYGVSTFSLTIASGFLDNVVDKIEKLSSQYSLHPECRFLSTKTTKYRNIILGNYLTIYRITLKRIEVLNIIHSSNSIATIQASRKIKM